VGDDFRVAAHSRSKNGVASLAYVAAIHVFRSRPLDVDARHKAGHDGRRMARFVKGR
jgi:hypothetical protein